MLSPSSSAPFRGFPAVHPFPKADALGYVLSPCGLNAKVNSIAAKAVGIVSVLGKCGMNWGRAVPALATARSFSP